MSRINVEISKSVFNPVYLPYLDNDTRFEVFYGGASSGKSVFVAQKKVYQHLLAPGRHTLVVRKVARTLRHSAFAEVVGVIRRWNLYNTVFRVNKSDMEIIRIDDKSRFIFAGLDDVEKLKSIRGVTDQWIEEASEITEDDFKQLNLRMRGQTGFPKQIDLTFNPISALSWQKRFFFDFPKPNATVLKTTYLDNQFLEEEDRQEIEALKERDPMYYKIYGLGEWGVIGNLVYTNYVIEEFDDTEFSDTQVYQGIDWGFNDPSVFIKIGFKDAEIYILDYVYKKKHTNIEFLQAVEQRNGKYENDRSVPAFMKNKPTKADSSEPARIKEWRQKGWMVIPARKGHGSVKFRIDFIRRHRIHIQPWQQEFVNEITSYCYREVQTSVNGLPKAIPDPDNPVDFNNHLMDAMGYALEDLANERKIRFG